MVAPLNPHHHVPWNCRVWGSTVFRRAEGNAYAHMRCGTVKNEINSIGSGISLEIPVDV